ncbi:MAG TPA: aminoglycoside phosphotransferase family protein [Acidimicrobiales bacterium]|nr:aminoglycoside phosphotransferase family protein [Acidimicrobiales bacterium]
MSGGTVAARIERVDISVAVEGDVPRTVAVVQKWTRPHEILGLEAAQAARPSAAAIPRLLADGTDEQGPWMIMPFYAGTTVTDALVPTGVFQALAILHATYAQAWTDLAGVPVVDVGWWRDICLSYSLGAVVRQAARYPSPHFDRARSVLERMADDGRIAEALEVLPRSLLHGDVHLGNILVADGDGVLVDWGSARVGSPMLDLANVAGMDSPGFTAYSDSWRHATGMALDPWTVQLGYRWAGVQIPIQYLAWVVEFRPSAEVGRALDRAEAALVALHAHLTAK